jgi:hypothetical protein
MDFQPNNQHLIPLFRELEIAGQAKDVTPGTREFWSGTTTELTNNMETI